jgi:hypothetical protein
MQTKKIEHYDLGNLQHIYHNSILYLGEYGRDPLTDDVIVLQPARERGREIVLPDVDDVQRVSETHRVDGNVLACKLANELIGQQMIRHTQPSLPEL